MTKRGIGFGGRLAALALATTFVLVLAGDGGRAATVPAVINGQDPLEVLSLKVRPNVVVVLDSSGSMKWTLDPGHGAIGDPANGGDHPRSKIWQAKQVLKTIVQNNQDKASFLFGQYTNGGGARMQNRGAGQNRFVYWTTEDSSPSMTTTELSVERSFDDSSGSDRGLQSWQVIHEDWNTLWFEEEGGSTCSAQLGGSFPRFYARGGSGTTPAVSTTPQNLAFDLQTAMNNASCGPQNTYSVSYNPTTGRFSFSAVGPVRFRLRNRASIATRNISEALGGVGTAWVDLVGVPPTTVSFTITDIDRRSTYTEVDSNGAHGVQVGWVCVVTNADTSLFNGTWTVTQIVDWNTFRMDGPTGNNRDGDDADFTCTGGGSPGAATSDAAYTLLYRADTPPSDNPSYGGSYTGFHNAFEEEIPPGSGNQVLNYQLRAGRFFNGEVVRVTDTGQVCDMTFPAAADRTDPPSVTLQQVGAGCGSDVGSPVTFSWAGTYMTGGSNFCDGFQALVDLVPCDLRSPPAPTQFTTIFPWIDNEAVIGSDGLLADYSETTDGTWTTVNYPAASAGGVKGYGSTPIAASLADIRAQFTNLWNNGQTGTTSMTGPPPYALDPIKDHLDPKEKTIVLFVTDGDDTCAGQGDNDRNALAAAYEAEQLYARIDATQPASSVQAFVIGYGGAFGGGGSPRLNWIAWGGSGLGDTATGQPDVPVGSGRWSPAFSGTYYEDCRAGSQCQSINNSLAPLRASCTTCEDAFIAPDAASLEATLQSIIDQGASSGEFSAQQSLTESIFEYAALAPQTGPNPFDPDDPKIRYAALAPTRLISSFTLPGFHGHLRAIQNDGTGNPIERWDAGEKLLTHVANATYGMGSCDTSSRGGGVGQCTFNQLHDGATEATITSSDATIQRRIFTTQRNGVYDFTVQSLIAGTASQRVTLWPPDSSLVPQNYISEALLPGGISFDEALGLPPAVPTDYPDPLDEADVNYDPFCNPDDLRPQYLPKKPRTECWLDALKRDYDACVGTNLPSVCTTGSTTDQMLAARREAREMILAFMAGAEAVPANPGIKRASSTGNGVYLHDILYKARSWVLADSELATPAVVKQPSLPPADPKATPWLDEYTLFYRGPRDGSGANPDPSGAIQQGFGLSSPDNDALYTTTRPNLKPVMTVVYAPANDMLHAFRAGPSVWPCDDTVAGSTDECGGQELWGFVPFDQVEALRLRLVNNPQGRDNHVYMLARGVRLADIFVAVPAADSPPIDVTISGQTESIAGVWRRVIYFGRGIGGKYLTALDVTGPGTYNSPALETLGPIPLWSRGNPDTVDGTSGGAPAGTAAHRLAYSAMGETWSMPALAFRDKSSNPNTVYNTTRRPDGIDFTLTVGSAWGGVGEGTTIFTLDALSGDVIADVDVEIAAAANGLGRGALPYRNGIPANVVGFNPGVFTVLQTTHPWATAPTRFYVGDIHGRLWKVLATRPDLAIPVADLGEDQPVGTAVSLLGMPPLPDSPVPHIYVSSGNDSRADGPFKNFAFRDDGTDTEIAIASGVVDNEVTTFPPAVSLHTRQFDQGDPLANCGYTEEAVFRGTIQPAAAFGCSAVNNGTCSDLVGRVFFGGTRLSLPNTKFAPPTPLACGTGDYPCRSTFDSIIYVLGAKTGLAAYDLNSSGDDAYRIFRDNRISAIAMLADPDPARGGSSFNPDEGKMQGQPKPPPPPGVPPTSTTATANVVMRREPGQPPPSVHYGSTVCQ